MVQVRTGVEGRSRDLLIPKSHVEPGAAEEGEGINPYQRQPQGRRGGFKSPNQLVRDFRVHLEEKTSSQV